MSKRNLYFYFLSFLVIFILLFKFFDKMNSTYEAKNNFLVFKEILKSFEKKENKDLNSFFIKENLNIIIKNDSNNLKIYVHNIDYRSCLKYGVEYIDSNFQSITINEELLTRENIVTRDIILEKCNKIFHNVIAFQKMEKK